MTEERVVLQDGKGFCPAVDELMLMMIRCRVPMLLMVNVKVNGPAGLLCLKTINNS